ncbi:MAG: anchored repeat-type ABC transporter permease subunit [Corynebacterium sp.]|nr:anchored repeat-type ABC transporter permease subunit [Corynebacterium sp.]
MLSPLDFIADLSNPQLAFLARALLVAMLSSVLCGVVGVHVVLRGMAFIGDAIAHAVFPGLAIAFVLGGSLMLGGILGGVTIAVIIALFAAKRHLPEDSTIGIFFAFAFAIGLVVLSRAQGYAGSLSSFLSGSITGVSTTDLWVTAAMTIVALGILNIFHRPLVAVGIDRESARAAGIPTLIVDIILYVTVALTIVTAVRTVGNILVIALLITPAATARLLTNRMLPMMIFSAAIGAVSSLIGVYIAWAVNVPVGASIVIAVTVLFLVAMCTRLPIFSKISAGASAAVMVAALVFTTVPQPPSYADSTNPCDGRTLLQRMHVDAVYVTRDNGDLTIKTIGDHTIYDANQVCMRVAPDTYNGQDVSRMVVPDDPALNFLGAPGTVLWHAPFDNYGFTWRPIWAGMGAFDPEHETLAPQAAAGTDAVRAVTLELATYDGPGDMEIFNYVNGWGRAHRFISSKDIHRTTLPIGGHAHMNWTFTQPGFYNLGWRAHLLHLDGTTESTPIITQTWYVGDDSAPTQATPYTPPAPATTAHSLLTDSAFDRAFRRISNEPLSTHFTGSITTSDYGLDITYDPDSPVLAIPDSDAVCVDPEDPFLGTFAKASGSEVMWRTAPGSVVFTNSGFDDHLLVDSSINGPAGFVSALGVQNTEDSFMPLRTIRMPESREVRLTHAVPTNLTYMFSHPGIYRENGTLGIDNDSGDYTFLGAYFLVGNAAINKWRANAGLDPLPETTLSCPGLPTLHGQDPHYHPFLPPVVEETETEEPVTEQPEPEQTETSTSATPSPSPSPSASPSKATEPEPVFEKTSVTVRRGHVDMAFLPGESAFHDTSNPAQPRWVNSKNLTLLVNPAVAEEADGQDLVYVLPQTQDPELPWLGFSTQYADFEKVHLDKQWADLSLESMVGPAGARLYASRSTLSGQSIILDSDDFSKNIRITPGVHEHVNFVFDKPGDYVLHFAYTWTDTEGTEHQDPMVLEVSIPASGAAEEISNTDPDKSETPTVSRTAPPAAPARAPSAAPKAAPKPQVSNNPAPVAAEPGSKVTEDGPSANMGIAGAVLAAGAAIGIANFKNSQSTTTPAASKSETGARTESQSEPQSEFQMPVAAAAELNSPTPAPSPVARVAAPAGFASGSRVAAAPAASGNRVFETSAPQTTANAAGATSSGAENISKTADPAATSVAGPSFWNGLLAGMGLMSLLVAVFLGGMMIGRKSDK